MEKRFGILGDDYLSIPDDDDLAFLGEPFTFTWDGVKVSDLKRDYTIIEVKDSDTHLIRFEVIRHG